MTSLPQVSSEVVEQFFDAAIGSTPWYVAVESFTKLVGAFGAVAFSIDDPGQSIPMSESLLRCHEHYLRDGWNFRDDRFNGIDVIRTKPVVVDFDLVTHDQILISPFYQEFLAKHQLKWAGIIPFYVEGKLWVLSVQRTVAQGPFELEEQLRLAQYSPHLSRAITLYSSTSKAVLSGKLQAIDAMGCCAFAISASGSVVAMNKAAEEIVGKGVHLWRKRLVADNRSDDTKRQTLVRQAVNARSEVDFNIRPVVINALGSRPLVARAISLKREAINLFCSGVAIILISQISPTAEVQTREIREIYALTESETNMAKILIGGGNVSDYAEQNGLRIASARQLVKQVLAKTGVHSQAQFVALALKLAVAAARVGS